MRSSNGTVGLQYSRSKSGHRLGELGVGGGGGGGGGLCGSGGDGGPAQANLKIWMALLPPQCSDELDGQVEVHPVLGWCEFNLSPLQAVRRQGGSSVARTLEYAHDVREEERGSCRRERASAASVPEALVPVFHTS